ncbi:MAG: hypothetical protein WAJ85_03760, partial [Candidatus Baltobacteraceae bacterium]
PIRTQSWPERVVAELHTGSAHLTIDAGPPPDRARRPLLLQIAALCLATLLAVFATVGYLYARPQVVALAAPDAVEGGTAFSIAYGLTGASNARYSIDSADGKKVAQGTLAAKDGSFSIALPAGTAAKGYDVRVIASNMLGADSRATHVVALPAAAELKIAASLQHSEVKGGDQVVVNYRTAATDGSIEIVDQLGTVRAETLLNPGGSSILIAPSVDKEQDYRVLVRASRGNSTREKQLSLRIEPGAPAPAIALGGAMVPAIDGIPPPAVPAAAPTVLPTSAAPSGAVAGTTDDSNAQVITVSPQFDLSAGDPIALTSKDVKSGATFAVKILHDEHEMHVALMDTTGDEVTGVDVAPGARTANLTAPHVHRPDKYLVVATFADGHGQETVVRPITVGTR